MSDLNLKDLSENTVAELREYATEELGIELDEGYIKKDDLIEKINLHMESKEDEDIEKIDDLDVEKEEIEEETEIELEKEDDLEPEEELKEAEKEVEEVEDVVLEESDEVDVLVFKDFVLGGKSYQGGKEYKIKKEELKPEYKRLYRLGYIHFVEEFTKRRKK